MSLFKHNHAIPLDVLDQEGEEEDPSTRREAIRLDEDVMPQERKKGKRRKKEVVEREHNEGSKREKKRKLNLPVNEEVQLVKTSRSKRTSTVTSGDLNDELALLDNIQIGNLVPHQHGDGNDFESNWDEKVEDKMKKKQLESALRRAKLQITHIHNSIAKLDGRSGESGELVREISEEDEVIKLSLQGADSENYKLAVDVNLPLAKLIETLSNIGGIPASELVLKLDGITLEPSKSPKYYSMQSDDLLVFERKKADNCSLSKSSKGKEKKIVLDEEEEEDGDKESEMASMEKKQQQQQDLEEEELQRQIDQKIKEQVEQSKKELQENRKNIIKLSLRTEKGEQYKYKVKKNDPFSKLIEAVATKENISPTAVILKFEGEKLSPKDCPSDHDLEDGDLLDLHFKK